MGAVGFRFHIVDAHGVLTETRQLLLFLLKNLRGQTRGAEKRGRCCARRHLTGCPLHLPLSRHSAVLTREFLEVSVQKA